MATASKTENRKRVKLALAEKYERLSRVAGSTGKRRRFVRRANRYRRQAAEIGR